MAESPPRSRSSPPSPGEVEEIEPESEHRPSSNGGPDGSAAAADLPDAFPPREAAAIFARLSDSAKRALAEADALRRKTGQDRIHMEHLLLGLYEKNPGPMRASMPESLDASRFHGILQEVTDLPLPTPGGRYSSGMLSALPKVSGHVRDAVVAARDEAGRSDPNGPIRSRHLVKGAFTITDCKPIAALLRAGVNTDGVLAWDEPTPAAHAPPRAAPTRKSATRPGRATQLPPPPLAVTAAAQTDQPTAYDLLGYSGLVDALASLLTGKSTTFPLTIAISAPWGGGKSSIMRQLIARLSAETKSAPWVIVYFPAWRYETGEQLWAAMAKATYDAGVKSRPGRFGGVRFRWALERKRLSVPRLVARVALPLAGGVVGAVLGTVLGNATGTPTEGTAAVGGVGGLVAVAQALWGNLSDPFKRAVESFAKEPGIESGDGFTPAAAANVDALMTLLLEKGGRVAIFIDDLDRCTPRSLVRVIEAVNQIFVAGSDIATEPGGASRLPDPAAPRVEPRRLAFIMGMDRQVVARGIEAEYAALKTLLEKEGDAAGRDYGLAFLDKIVQLWVTLPTPTTEGLDILLRTVAGFPSGSGPDNAQLIARIRSEMAEEIRGIPADDRAAIAAAARRVEQRADADSRVAARWARQSFLSSFVAPSAAESPEVWAAMQEGAACLERNPRQVKRFNNAFRLQLALASGAFQVTFTRDQLGALARWVAIRLRWGALAHAMDDDPQLLGALEREANGRREVSRVNAADSLRQRKRTPEWFSEKAFPDLPELRKALRVGRRSQAISQLPFEAFLQIA